MSSDSKPRAMDVIRAKSWRRTYSTHDGGVIVTQTERMTNGRVGVLLPLGSCFESEPFDLRAAFDAIARANGYVKNDEALAMVDELVRCCDALINCADAGRDFSELREARRAIEKANKMRCKDQTAGDGSGGGAPQRSRDAASSQDGGTSNPA